MLLYFWQGSLDELWGVAHHPSSDQFVTGSVDGVMACGDAGEKKLLWTHSFEVKLIVYSH